MGRKARQREEELLAREQKFTDGLRAHNSRANKHPEPLDWQKVIFGAINSHRDYWINDPSIWVNTKKTKNMDTLRLDMVRHVFGVYKCPSFLEQIWLPEPNGARHLTKPKERENSLIKYVPWYLTVAQGGSLYKERTKGTMTKKETHAFLHAPKNNTLVQNIWWARAFCESDGNIGIASRVAKSRLAARALTNEFWISVMRFFVRFPAKVHEMNDLMDFFSYMHGENENYSLKGRSLEAVRINCEEWHRFLNKQKSIGGGSWEGSMLENARYTTGKDEKKIIWRITQIRTGNDLLREGQKMRHCVSSYKRKCMSGECSIWSMTSQDAVGNIKRCLTIELTKHGTLVQVRGLANRMPRPEEENILHKWAGANGLQRRNNYW